MLHTYSMIPESSLLWLQSWQAIISCNSALSSFSSSSLCFALLPPALLLRSLETKNRMTNWHLRGMVITGSHMFKGYKYQWCAFDGWKGPERDLKGTYGSVCLPAVTWGSYSFLGRHCLLLLKLLSAQGWELQPLPEGACWSAWLHPRFDFKVSFVLQRTAPASPMWAQKMNSAAHVCP